MHKRRRKKYFWHSGNLAPRNFRLKKARGKRNAETVTKTAAKIAAKIATKTTAGLKVTTKTVPDCPSPPSPIRRESTLLLA